MSRDANVGERVEAGLVAWIEIADRLEEPDHRFLHYAISVSSSEEVRLSQ